MAAQTWEVLLNSDNAQNAGTALANSVTLTDISPAPTLVLPGNYLQRGSGLRVTAAGTFSNTATPTLLLGVYYGGVAGTALATSGAVTTTTGATNWPWQLEWEGFVRTSGSTGTLMGNGKLFLATSLTAYSVIPIPNVAMAAVTINTTTANAFTIGGQWGTASASNTTTVQKFMIESLAY